MERGKAVKYGCRIFCWLVLGLSLCFAQATPASVSRLLETQIRHPEVTVAELQHYLLGKVPDQPRARSAEDWTKEAERLRTQLLQNIVFHGWPREWVEAPLKIDDLGLVPVSGHGYRIRKLRYEIVPGFYSVALLYEPENLRGRAPAIINVNGHNDPGKALEWKQKRCINQALRGILALNLEWIYFGELKKPENAHFFGSHLDLVGANAVGLFYLAMRKGLDYLWQHPNVDRNRIGMTGLSGGGWQTIMLSALDQRVQVSVPVAGYSSIRSRIERPSDIGDIEQNPTDMLTVADYTHLTAMRAPRPTLLIYNAEDSCCFRGPLVRPYIFDAIKPIFGLYGAEDRLAWHLNTDPSDHNYQLDNRQQAYAFFTKYFGLSVAEKEIPVAEQIKSPEELRFGIPEDNLTILSLAKHLAARIRQPKIPQSGDAENDQGTERQRSRLKEVIRFQPVHVTGAWAVSNTYSKGMETKGFFLRFSNGLSASALWLKALASADTCPATVVLHDKGRRASAEVVSDRINRGEQVLAVDLLFTGDGTPQRPGPAALSLLLGSVGDRPLGMESAQCIAAAQWLRNNFRPQNIRLETTGIRTQVIALAAAALAPDLFREVAIHEGMPSLDYLLEKPVRPDEAPELFCLDLYKEFDLSDLIALRKKAIDKPVPTAVPQ